MNSIHIISQDVFDKIRSRFSNLEMGDETGAVTSDPKKARFFDFDFVLENENLGRVSISINEIGSLKIFYSQGILEDTESYVKTLWYDFLREMRMFAKRRLLRFDTRDITKSHLDKNDFQYLASTGQKDEITMQESKMFGSSKSSYLPLEKTKLIVRHNKPVDETQIGARSRRHNIKALYIENQDGERFKYPFEHLAGAKAMQRHVANGGRPYDNVGKKIIEMSQHIAELTAFKRHVHGHDKMNYEINEITEKADTKLQNLKQTMENLCRQGFYENWKESVQPFNDDEQMVLDQATMEDYKSKFTVKSFKEDLTQFFPLIHKIMQEAGTIDLESYQEDSDSQDDELTVEYTKTPFEDFENWADRIVEGRIEPDTLVSLRDLVEAGLTLGADGLSAIEALEGIGIHDEKLEKALVELAKVNPEADPVPTIKAWLTKEDPEAAEELGMKTDDLPNQEDDLNDQPMIDQEVENESFEKEPNIREIAEMVKSFYDRETGKFPKGKTGVVVHVKKELGEKAGMLAEKLVDKLEAETMNQDQQVDEIAPVLPVLAAGARMLLPMIAKAGTKIGPALGSMARTGAGAAANVAGRAATGVGRGAVELGKATAQSAAQNAGKIGIGMGAYTALTDLADKFAGGVGEIYDDAKNLASDIGSIVGVGVNKETIAALSEWAVKNAIPIGIIIALLYGGWKLLGSIIREDEEMERIQQLAGLKKKLSEGSYTEASALDKQRDKLGSQGYISTQDDRLNDKERHNQNMQNMHDRNQAWQDAYHQSSLDRMSNSDQLDAARTQHEIDVLAHRLGRMQKDDDDWKDTFDMMRDRINRYQYSTQRDVDPEQLEKITNIKYKPTQRENNEVASTESPDNLQVGQMVKFGIWSKPQEHQTGKVVSVKPGFITVSVDGEDLELSLANKSLSVYPAEQKPTFNPGPSKFVPPDVDRIQKLAGLVK